MHGMPEEARKGTLNLISSFTPFPPFDSYLLDQFNILYNVRSHKLTITTV